MSQHIATDRIGTFGRHTANGIAGIKVFHRHRAFFFREILVDFHPQELADVFFQQIAGGVANLAAVFNQLLAGALGHNDNRVILAGFKTPLQRPQQPVLALQLKIQLRHQTEVNHRIGQRRVSGDESRISPHQLNQPDAVEHPLGFGMGGADNRDCLSDRGLETETAADEHQVVVDGLWNAHHANRQIAAFALLRNVVGAPQ